MTIKIHYNVWITRWGSYWRTSSHPNTNPSRGAASRRRAAQATRDSLISMDRTESTSKLDMGYNIWNRTPFQKDNIITHWCCHGFKIEIVNFMIIIVYSINNKTFLNVMVGWHKLLSNSVVVRGVKRQSPPPQMYLLIEVDTDGLLWNTRRFVFVVVVVAVVVFTSQFKHFPMVFCQHLTVKMYLCMQFSFELATLSLEKRPR